MWRGGAPEYSTLVLWAGRTLYPMCLGNIAKITFHWAYYYIAFLFTHEHFTNNLEILLPDLCCLLLCDIYVSKDSLVGYYLSSKWKGRVLY